jgi:hypothetical protein
MDDFLIGEPPQVAELQLAYGNFSRIRTGVKPDITLPQLLAAVGLGISKFLSAKNNICAYRGTKKNGSHNRHYALVKVVMSWSFVIGSK